MTRCRHRKLYDSSKKKLGPNASIPTWMLKNMSIPPNSRDWDITVLKLSHRMRFNDHQTLTLNILTAFFAELPSFSQRTLSAVDSEVLWQACPPKYRWWDWMLSMRGLIRQILLQTISSKLYNWTGSRRTGKRNTQSGDWLAWIVKLLSLATA